MKKNEGGLEITGGTRPEVKRGEHLPTFVWRDYEPSWFKTARETTDPNNQFRDLIKKMESTLDDIASLAEGAGIIFHDEFLSEQEDDSWLVDEGVETAEQYKFRKKFDRMYKHPFYKMVMWGKKNGLVTESEASEWTNNLEQCI